MCKEKYTRFGVRNPGLESWLLDSIQSCWTSFASSGKSASLWTAKFHLCRSSDYNKNGIQWFWYNARSTQLWTILSIATLWTKTKHGLWRLLDFESVLRAGFNLLKGDNCFRLSWQVVEVTSQSWSCRIHGVREGERREKSLQKTKGERTLESSTNPTIKVSPLQNPAHVQLEPPFRNRKLMSLKGLLFWSLLILPHVPYYFEWSLAPL